MAMNGLSMRGPASWMACATSSLPVPLSPVIRMFALLGTTFSMTVKTRWRASEFPKMFLKEMQRWLSSWRRISFSLARPRRSMMFLMRSRTSSILVKGFLR